MLKHNFIIFFRSFKLSKSSFFINLIGLSSGIACTLLIFMWVNDEINFDKFHKNDSHLFQVMQNVKMSNNIVTWDRTPCPVAETLLEEMPEVERATSVFDAPILGKPNLRFGDKSIKANFVYAGKDFFNIFSFKLIEGNPNQVLDDKNSIVISENLAMKLFNTTINNIGKQVRIGDKKTYQISGVFKNIPSNSSLQFDFLLTYEELKDYFQYPSSFFDWGGNNIYTYVILKQGTDLEHFNNKITKLINSKSGDSYRSLFAKRYSEKYLYGTYENGKQAGGRIEYVNLFSIIAIFILVIACINFMNLSTAKASRRIKEIGVKKALGVSRKSLIFQYLGESMLMALFSLLVAIFIVWLLLPQFNEITGKRISMDFNIFFILTILSITLFTGFVAGSYPALYLSGFNSVKVLKGKLNNSIGELLTRKGLVVVQFVLSIVLIVSVLLVYKQIDYIQSRKLGFDKDNIIYFDREGRVAEMGDAFLSEIKNIPGIINATSAGFNLIGTVGSTMDIGWEGKQPDDITNFEIKYVNYDFIETFDIEMKEGRSFSKKFGSDNSNIIFNETAIKTMGIKDPIGKEINMWGQKKQIIGVTNDFHFESLHKEVNPLLFVLPPPSLNLLVMVKIKAGAEKETIGKLEEFYEQYNPGFAFEYKFLDADYQAQYAAEKRIGILSQYFAVLAILILCLGLLGIAAFTAEKRYKEIGVRKALGSNDFSIIFLLLKDITKPAIISLIIALPFSYFMAKSWLNGFAYKTDLKLWYFVLAGILTLCIAWITVGWQTYKATRVNVADCMRIND